jgi:D-lactate dehydrogenase
VQRRYLATSLSPAEIAAQRALKRALDPRGILNPGKIFPDGDISTSMPSSNGDPE